MRRSVIFFIFFLLIHTMSVRAHQGTGSLRIILEDPDQSGVPVSVLLIGPKGTQRTCQTSIVTSCIFTNLVASERYEVRATLEDKTTLIPGIPIKPGRETLLFIFISKPLKDAKAVITSYRIYAHAHPFGLILDDALLSRLPSARDTLSALLMAPATLEDLENLTSARAGEPVTVSIGGSAPEDIRWLIDDVDVTDPAVPGLNPFSLNETLYEQIIVSASDPMVMNFSGGPTVNLLTPTEGKGLQLDAHFFWTGSTLQDDNTAGVSDNLISEIARPVEIRDHRDMGFHGLANFFHDHMILWAGLGRRTINRRLFLDERDTGHLTSWIVKSTLTLQDHHASLLALRSNQFRRSLGHDFTRPDATRWDLNTPAWLLALTDDWSFSHDIDISFRLSYQKNRFDLIPRGGIDVPVLFDFATGLWEQSFYWYQSTRQRFSIHTSVRLLRSNWLKGDHTIELGFEYRDGRIESMSGYGNGMVIARYNPRWKIGAGEIWLFRQASLRPYIRQFGLYLKDEYRRGRLLITAGLRLDRQQNGSRTVQVPANDLIGNVSARWLPEGQSNGGSVVTWTSLSPRLNVAFDITGRGTSILSIGLARYPSVLGVAESNALQPTVLREVDLFWIRDRNGDGLPQTGEVDMDFPIFADHRPGEPNRVLNAIDDRYDPVMTTDITLKLEHAFASRFKVALTYFQRRTGDLNWVVPYDPDGLISLEELFNCWSVAGSLPDELGGRPYYFCSVPKPDGLLFTRREGARIRYRGFDLAVKGQPWPFLYFYLGYTYQNRTQSLEGPRAVLDPTGRDLLDGGAAPIITPGSGRGEIWMHARWTARFILGLNLPARFRLTTTLRGREGYLYPVFYTAFRPSNGWGSQVPVLLDRPGKSRLPELWVVNARLSRMFPLGDLGQLELILDVFNLLNNDAPLALNADAGSPFFGKISELMEPRTFRVGVHWSF